LGAGDRARGSGAPSKPGWHRAAVQSSCFCPLRKENFKEEIPAKAILFRAQLVFVIP